MKAELQKLTPVRNPEVPLLVCEVIRTIRKLAPGGPTFAEFRAWPAALQRALYWELRNPQHDGDGDPTIEEVYAIAAELRAERLADDDDCEPTAEELDALERKAVSR